MQNDQGSLDQKILALNGLGYNTPEELSVANAHRLRSFVSLRNDYISGAQGYIDISVGTDLIDGKASWLQFEVAVANEAASLSDNGVMGLFRQTVVRARSGQELSRFSYANLYNHDSMPFECQAGTMNCLASGMGTNTTFPQNTWTKVAIPLPWLNPFFSGSRLIPTQCIGTLRLEFLLANKAEAMFSAGGTHDFAVRNVEILVDTYSLADSALRSLSMVAAQSGLAYSWSDVHTTLATSDGQHATMVSLKSASRATGAHVHIVETADFIDAQKDSMVNETYDVSQYQFSLGSMYMPAAPITHIVSAFYNALNGFDSLKHCREFSADITYNKFVERYGIPTVTLERSSVLQANGMATSSSRPLIADIYFANAKQRSLFLFLRYQRVLLCLSDSNLVLKE
jgi:hypothetical protein